MTTQFLDSHPEIAAVIAEHHSACATYAASLEEIARITEYQTKQKALADSAEAEAGQARKEAMRQLRIIDGDPKALRELKAKERAAYTLAEDYQAFVAELENAKDDAEIAAVEIAVALKHKQSAALESYKAALVDDVVAACLGHVRAVERSNLFDRATLVSELSKRIATSLSDAPAESNNDPVREALDLPAGIYHYLNQMRSPICFYRRKDASIERNSKSLQDGDA